MPDAPTPHPWTLPVRRASLVVLLVAVVALVSRLPVKAGVAALGDLVAGLGAWGPVLYGAIYAVAVVLLAPASALTVAAGALFGLGVGTATVSIASTTGAALAFLVARYFARERVAAWVSRYPKFEAIDGAIRDGGWRIVALLRLSPAVPFNLQNYLYGLTGIRFWTCVLTSWIAMLPGTFLYVYFGYLARAGAEAAAGGAAGGDGSRAALTWTLRVVGLLATIAVTFYVTKIARKAIADRTAVATTPAPAAAPAAPATPPSVGGTLGLAALALVVAVSATTLVARPQALRGLFGPPQVEAKETFERRAGGPAVDHSLFDDLLRRHVRPGGFVDYAALQAEVGQLDAYLAIVAAAEVDALDRDERLALLVNAYNAATLRLILDHWPLASIKDIPDAERWSAVRWKVGGKTLSLDQIEHGEIRPNFAEPRIHFALVCAAVGCPPLRAEAYVAGRLDAQLDDQLRYAHSHDRWLRYEPGAATIALTRLYDWYGGDFEQAAGSVLDFVARTVPALREALDEGDRPRVEWLDYDWKVNDVGNAEKQR